MLGAFCVVGLPKLFDDSVEIGLLTSGAGLLILLLYFPGGLVQVLLQRRATRCFAWSRAPAPAGTRTAPDGRAADPRCGVACTSAPLPEGSTR